MVIDESGRAADKYLTNERFAVPRSLAKRSIDGRHRTPAQQREAGRLHDVTELLLKLATLGSLGRQKNQATTVLTRVGQRYTRLPAGLDQEAVRHLHQYSGAIAGVGFAAAGAAMIEVAQHLDRLLHDAMRLATLDVDNKAHAAGIVLEPGVVESLLARGPRNLR